MNVFFNDLDDLVWRNTNAGPNDPIYQNAGFLKSWGVEPEISYARQMFNVNGNVTYQRAGDAQNYEVTGPQIHNVPNWTWNAIVNLTPAATAAHEVRFNLTARYIGGQRSPVNITIGNAIFVEPNRQVDGVFPVNAGVRAGRLWSTRVSLDGRLYNVFDKKYDQGGSVSHPYPQAGRSALLTVGYAF